MKLINTKTHLIGDLDKSVMLEETDTFGVSRVIPCLQVNIEGNGVMVDALYYKSLKELLEAGWVDYE